MAVPSATPQRVGLAFSPSSASTSTDPTVLDDWDVERLSYFSCHTAWQMVQTCVCTFLGCLYGLKHAEMAKLL